MFQYFPYFIQKYKRVGKNYTNLTMKLLSKEKKVSQKKILKRTV